MAVNAGEIPCIIHFEGKDGPQKQLSNETLRTFIQRRKEWLQLPDNCELEKYHQSRDIAKRSYDYLAYDIENVEELPEAVSYHLSCYRNFTDITKIQRAQKIAADVNSRKTKSVECESNAEGPQEKIKRTTRQSFGPACQNGTTSKSSNILPERCLICKKYGSIYVTDPVRLL